jgi:hypothetical protein
MGTRINRHRFLRAQSDEQLRVWAHDARYSTGQFGSMPDRDRWMWLASITAEQARRAPMPDPLELAA